MAFKKEFENLFRSFAELREQQAKLTDSQACTDEQMKKTDKQIEKVFKELGNISNNNGAVAEDFFWNGLKNRKEFEGITIDYSERNTHRKLGKIEDEFDIILYNGNSVIIIETKYKVRLQDIETLKDRKIPNFRQLFREKANQKIYGAIAGWNMTDEAIDFAKQEGFFILSQSGDNLAIEKGEVKAY